jgi:hypothetical protein
MEDDILAELSFKARYPRPTLKKSGSEFYPVTKSVMRFWISMNLPRPHATKNVILNVPGGVKSMEGQQSRIALWIPRKPTNDSSTYTYISAVDRGAMLLLDAVVRDAAHDFEPAAAAASDAACIAPTRLLAVLRCSRHRDQPPSCGFPPRPAADIRQQQCRRRSSESGKSHSSAGADDPAPRRPAALPTESILAALQEEERQAATAALAAAARLAAAEAAVRAGHRRGVSLGRLPAGPGPLNFYRDSCSMEAGARARAAKQEGTPALVAGAQAATGRAGLRAGPHLCPALKEAVASSASSAHRTHRPRVAAGVAKCRLGPQGGESKGWAAECVAGRGVW